jgi:RNA polymerase sigma-70 factor (ECF subfamily)
MAIAAAGMPALRHRAGGAQNALLAGCYRAFAAPLRSFLERHTHCAHEAEDLAQEVFLRMCRMGAHSEVRHLRGLVYKTANNLLKDRSRRTYTRMMRDAVPAATVEWVDWANEPSCLLESAQTLAVFCVTLDNLQPTTRTAFLMYRVEGCTQAQIAAAMGVSASMVEKHVSHAMTALRNVGINERGAPLENPPE